MITNITKAPAHNGIDVATRVTVHRKPDCGKVSVFGVHSLAIEYSHQHASDFVPAAEGITKGSSSPSLVSYTYSRPSACATKNLFAALMPTTQWYYDEISPSPRVRRLSGGLPHETRNRVGIHHSLTLAITSSASTRCHRWRRTFLLKWRSDSAEENGLYNDRFPPIKPINTSQAS